MNAPPGRLLVSVGNNCACVKVIGRANFTSSVDFKTLLSELLQQGFNYFALDLAECVLMDSTFLGVLAGFGLKLSGPQADGVKRTLELFNPNPRVLELLENLGVLHLFNVTRGEIVLPEASTPREPSRTNPSPEEVTQACLDAHKTLMAIHPDNVGRFKEVTQFLAEDLKKLRSGS